MDIASDKNSTQEDLIKEAKRGDFIYAIGMIGALILFIGVLVIIYS